jgi:hypothetical protein
VDTNKLIVVYVKIRDARSEAKHKYDEVDAKLKDQLNLIEAALMASMTELNVTTLKTPQGTASRTTRTRYWAPDWNEFKNFALENDASDLFERRIHQSNMREFIEQNPEVVPPIAADSRYSIVVRRGK